MIKLNWWNKKKEYNTKRHMYVFIWISLTSNSLLSSFLLLRSSLLFGTSFLLWRSLLGCRLLFLLWWRFLLRVCLFLCNLCNFESLIGRSLLQHSRIHSLFDCISQIRIEQWSSILLTINLNPPCNCRSWHSFSILDGCDCFDSHFQIWILFWLWCFCGCRHSVNKDFLVKIN